jgi:hypothetical protein
MHPLFEGLTEIDVMDTALQHHTQARKSNYPRQLADATHCEINLGLHQRFRDLCAVATHGWSNLAASVAIEPSLPPPHTYRQPTNFDPPGRGCSLKSASFMLTKERPGSQQRIGPFFRAFLSITTTMNPRPG